VGDLPQQMSSPPPSTPAPLGLEFLADVEYEWLGVAGLPNLPASPPSMVDHSPWLPPAGDQGSQNSCVGWAVAYGLRSYCAALAGCEPPTEPDRQFSPAYVYNQLQSGACNLGITMKAGLDLLQAQGCATLALMPYQDGNCSATPGDAARAEAARFKIESWSRLEKASTVGAAAHQQQVREYLAAGASPLIAVRIYPQFLGLQGPGATYNSAAGENLGGHAMLAVGYDDNRSAFKVLNSYGVEWGDGGYCWIPYGFWPEVVREVYVVADSLSTGNLVFLPPSLTISGPSAVAAAASATFTASATTGGGCHLDVTDKVVWTVTAGRFEGSKYFAPSEFYGLVSITTHLSLGGGAREASIAVAVNGPNRAPAVSITATPSTGHPPLAVAFNAAATDPDGDALTYTWDFGDGEAASIPNPSHTYTGVGRYTASVVVSDPSGATGAAAQSVVIQNSPPIARIAASRTRGGAPLAVAFMNQSQDPDGDTLSLLWDFGSGATSTDANPRYVFTELGTHTVRLSVTDPFGASNTATYEVHVHRPETVRIRATPDGREAASQLSNLTCSGTGRYLAFISDATDLVPNDHNGCADAFWLDRQTGELQRVSVASDGSEATAASQNTVVSGNGRYVAFASAASNLVPGDTNDRCDVFVRDVQTGTTRRVSVSSSGQEGYGGDSTVPTISADGRYVCFQSNSPGFLPVGHHGPEIFVYDTQGATLIRISVFANDSDANPYCDLPCMSSDGNTVSFRTLLCRYPGDWQPVMTILRWRRNWGLSSIMDETTADGWSYRSAVGTNGIAYSSEAGNLAPGGWPHQLNMYFYREPMTVACSVKDQPDGIPPHGPSDEPCVSVDDNHVAFTSSCALVNADTNNASDIYVRDLRTLRTRRMSVAWDGTQANNNSACPCFASGARYVFFLTQATNLVPGESVAGWKIMLHDRDPDDDGILDDHIE
jgi:PKD repeat protein